jgi:Domain of unknown function (DUF4349)
MSQPDLVTQLREARPTAPPELRERVQLIAARAPRQPRRLSWRLGAVVAFAALLAVAAAVLATRHDEHAAQPPSGDVFSALDRGATPKAAAPSAEGRILVPDPVTGRIQRYQTYVELRVPTASRLSDATKRALAVTKSLGGYASLVTVDGRGKSADAELRLRIPRARVEEAVTRLARLGTITEMNVSVQDLQAGLNATERRIARLQKQLRELRAQPPTERTAKKIDALTAQVERLQRGRAQTIRGAHYATVQLHLTTPKVAAPPAKPEENGPLHGLGVAFRWIGIGAIYALALGAPFLVLAGLAWLAARTLRRRREEALLSRS